MRTYTVVIERCPETITWAATSLPARAQAQGATE
jgi:hypothetical protein